MSNDSARKAIIVVLLTAVLCSTFVSAAVVVLRPIQLNNKLLDQGRNIVALTGMLPAGETLGDDELLDLLKSLDARVIDIDTGQFEASLDPWTFDMRRAVGDPERGVDIPADQNLANIGRRSRYAPVYLVWKDDALERVILPVRGAGMWSMLYGYIAMESDLTTIAGMSFYEQNETPGLGDQITSPHWLAQWSGKQMFDDVGVPRFNVSEGTVQEGSVHAPFQVDGLTGATVTGDAVTGLIHYWFGPHGYQNFFNQMKDNPPASGEEGS